jgi:iron complex outermembrane receptor protein
VGLPIRAFLPAQAAEPEPPPAAGAPAPTPAKSEAPALEVDLDTLLGLKVETASKFEQFVSEVPASVTVIERADIQKYGYRTLAEILRAVPGLHVSYDRVYSFLGTRGFAPGDFNSRVLLLVDGHRVNQNLSDAAQIDTGFIADVDLIERVEVIRGPGSAIYGNNALFGVINVITRRGADMVGHGAEGSFAYGTFDTYQGRATYGHAFKNGPEILLSGTYYDSQGDDHLYYPEFNQPTNNFGVFEDGDTDRFYSGLAKVSYRDFTLQGAFIDREKRNPTAQHITAFNDNRHQVDDARAYVDLKFDREFSEHDLNVLARAYYDWYEFEGHFPFTVGAVTYEQDQRRGQWWGIEGQATKGFWDRLTLSLGAEYRQDFDQQRQYARLEPAYQELADTSRDRQSYAVYLHGVFEVFTNKLTLDAGLRYDGYDQFEDAINPRAALIYQPWTTSTFKGIYGTAFRVPNFFELFDPFNQDIDPETVTTYELAYEQKIGKHLGASVAGFYNVIDDAIAFDFDTDQLRYRNFEGATATGVEVALDAVGATEGWSRGLRARLSYTYQETENDETDERLTDSPRHLAKLNVSAPLWAEKIFAGVELQYTGDRTSAHIAETGQLLPGEEADDFVVVNLTLFSRDLVKNLEFSASVYNVFDAHYDDPATAWHLQDLLEQNGRTFRVKLAYRF